MSSEVKQTVLAVCISEKVKEVLIDTVGDSSMVRLVDMDTFSDEFENYNDGSFDFVLCGSKLDKDGEIEVAQIVRNQCPRTPILYATENKECFAPKVQIKNGFNYCYLVPVDESPFKNKMSDLIKSDDRKKRAFRSVRIVDLEADSEVDFDTYVYLPLNKKYVQFSGANQNFSDKKVKKLQEKDYGSLYVEQKDLSKFYEYTANQLKDMSYGAGPMSATEREEKLQESIRNLFGDIFDQSTKGDYESGKEMINTCQKIVSNYITDGASDNWYNQIISTIGGQKGGYNHAANVSTYAALFAIGIQHKNPEDLAMAGFLHDISLADFPDEVLNKPQSEWTDEQVKAYHHHPQKSLNIIKERKMIVSEAVENAIKHHHEKFNGKGFPEKLQAMKISMEGQLLSLADQFDYLTSEQEGQKRHTPHEAIEVIAGNGSINPQIISKVRKLFPKPDEDSEEKAS